MASQNQLYTQSDYLSALQAAIKQINPDISTVSGDVIDCLFRAVSQVLSAASLNQIDPDTFWSLSTKFGSDLDAFGAFLGFERLNGQKANVTLQFYLSTPSNTDFILPVGLQVEDASGHVFATTSQVSLSAGEKSVLAPAVAQKAGTEGNVEAFTLSSFASAVSPSLQVQNPEPATGGTNAETDAQFRLRIKQNLFCRQIGTAASFNQALLEVDDNSRAATIGAQKWHTQYGVLGDIKGGIGLQSDVSDAQYVYPDSSYLIKNSGTANQTDYSAGIAYDFDLTNPTVPVFEIAATGALDLSSYSGAALDALGKQIGLARDPGSPATGMCYFSLLTSVNSTTIIPAYTAFTLSGNQFQTTKNAFIEPLGQTSGAVPFTGLQAIDWASQTPPDSGESFNVNAGTLTPGNLYGTISAFSPGAAPWSDEEYRSQLAAFLASQSGLNAGDMVYTAFQYNPACSRCDIPSGVTNKVDIFIDGSLSQAGSETGLISLTQLSSEEGQNWITQDGNNVPAGSYIQLLGTPAIAALESGQVSIGGQSYIVSLAKEGGKNARSLRSRAALVFQTGDLPQSGSSYVISFTQNKALIDSQYEADKITPLGLDVLVHEGREAMVSANLEVLPMTNATKSQIQTDIESLLDTYFSQLPFGAFINFSAILSTVQSSPYVQSCAFSEQNPLSVDYPFSSGSFTATTSFYLASDSYPTLGTVSFVYGRAGSFGAQEGQMPNIFIANN